jgi:hypothetical protein
MSQYLIRNGQAVAHIMGSTTLKSVRASRSSVEDTLNAEFPAVLVNAYEYTISSAKKYQGEVFDEYAKPLPGGRHDEFLIF